jgi:hypothetical protein
MLVILLLIATHGFPGSAWEQGGSWWRPARSVNFVAEFKGTHLKGTQRELFEPTTHPSKTFFHCGSNSLRYYRAVAEHTATESESILKSRLNKGIRNRRRLLMVEQLEHRQLLASRVDNAPDDHTDYWVLNVSNTPTSATLATASEIIAAKTTTRIEVDTGNRIVTAGSLPMSLNQQKLQTYRLTLAPPDSQPPTITEIIAAGSAWSPAFIDAVDGSGVGAGNGLGYSLASGLTMPNAGIDRIYIQFSEPVVGFDATNVVLLGVNVADYSSNPGALTVTYDSLNRRGLIQLATSIAKDKLRVGVSDAVTDTAFNSLDGDANASPGGDLNFRFNSLVGDASSG